MVRWFSVAMVILCSTTPVAAQQGKELVRSSGGFLIADALHASCSSADADEGLACRVYMMAIADSMAMHKDNGWAPQVLCGASELQVDQLGSIYIDFLNRNPERKRWTAASVAYAALAEKFPCTP